MRKKLIFSFQNFKNCYWNGKDQSAVRDFSIPDILNWWTENVSYPFSIRAYILTSCCPILISKESSESLKKLLPHSSRFRSRENAPRTSRLQVTLSVNHMCFQHQVIKTFKSCHFTFLSLFCDCVSAFSKTEMIPLIVEIGYISFMVSLKMSLMVKSAPNQSIISYILYKCYVGVGNSMQISVKINLGNGFLPNLGAQKKGRFLVLLP